MQNTSHATLARIAARATTLIERLTLPTSPVIDPELQAVRLARWRKAAAKDDPVWWERRLRWSGWDQGKLTAVLGSLPDLPDLPPWALTLDEVLRLGEALQEGDLPAPDSTPAGTPFGKPFIELWQPFVLLMQQRLGTHPTWARLSESAQDSLVWALRTRLATIGGPTVQDVFWRARTSQNFQMGILGQQGWTKVRSGQQAAQERHQYARFVRELLHGGFRDFFAKYSRLARLLVLATDQHIAWISEFLDRLQADWAAIAQTFSPGNLLAMIAELDAELSDPHRHGRGVLGIRFDTGLRLIYKPRDLSADLAYNGLIAWLNVHTLHKLRTLQVITRDGYGWVECAELHDCSTQDEVNRYYERVGMLTCIMFLLAATDLHDENVIASGEYPIPIDLETLLMPDISIISAADSALMLSTHASYLFKNSVMTSGLLPRGHKSGEQDLSGLGSGELAEVLMKVPIWYNVNTDDMAYFFDTIPIHTGRRNSQSQLNGMPMNGRAYRAQVSKGFADTYRVLLEHRDALLLDQRVLGPFANLDLRIVIRSTNLYYQLARNSYEPATMQEGVDHSLYLEHLARAYLLFEEKPHLFPTLMQEIASLERLDIPYFHFYSNSAALPLEDGGAITGYFTAPGYLQLSKTLLVLSEQDLQRQLSYIEASLIPRTGQLSPSTGAHAAPPADSQDTTLASIPDADTWLAEAIHIGDRLDALAIHVGEWTTWPSLHYDDDVESFQLQVIDNDLYAGLPGVALFLCALTEVTGNGRYQGLALSALRVIADAQRRGKFSESRAVGGASGVTSTLYGVVKCAQFSGDPWIPDLARALAADVTPDKIAVDTALDVISGSAGSILSLLALYRLDPDDRWLALADTCGKRLLATQREQSAGAAWQTIMPVPLGGFSHGVAGIACALVKLTEATGDETYCEAAHAGIHYEQSLFDPDHNNWLDLRVQPSARPSGERAFMTSWCHGAPGIALSRISGLEHLDNPAIRADIAIGLKTTAQPLPYAIDHMCCGVAGRVSILLTAAEKLGQPELRDSANRLAAQMLARARARGGYRVLGAVQSPVENPGFFNGIAGMGYSLLQLASAQLPQILLWE